MWNLWEKRIAFSSFDLGWKSKKLLDINSHSFHIYFISPLFSSRVLAVIYETISVFLCGGQHSALKLIQMPAKLTFSQENKFAEKVRKIKLWLMHPNKQMKFLSMLQETAQTNRKYFFMKLKYFLSINFFFHGRILLILYWAIFF